MQKFKEEHREAIERNKRRPTKDDIWIRAMLEEEQSRKKKWQDEHAKEANGGRERSGAKVDTKAIIEELRASDLPAEVVLDRQRKKQIEQEMSEKEEAQRRKRDKQGG